MKEQFFVTINNVPDPEIFADIAEIVVDTDVFMPSMFTITLEDSADPLTGLFKHADSLKYQLGAAVEISMVSIMLQLNELPVPNVLVKGEITSIEPVFSSGTTYLKIRGYDRSHRMMAGKKTRTWGDGNPLVPTLTEAQMVSRIAIENGLIPVVDGTLNTLMYHYVLQYSQSDYEFLWSRAQMLGYQMWVDDRSLHFQKAGMNRNLLPPVPLKWGGNLHRFEPRMVASGQVDSVTTMGWDPKLKREVKETNLPDLSATNAKWIGLHVSGSTAAKVAFMSKAEDFVIDASINSIPVAKQIASARYEANQSQFIKASGETVDGNPNLVAGNQVMISGVSQRFSGLYYVTSARHVYTRGGYRLQFQVSGRNPFTFRYLILGDSNGVGVNGQAGKLDGLVTGVVTNNKDPEMQGRVRVKFPWMPAGMTETESSWARLAAPSAGSGQGILFIPEINDEVLVAFEHGDFSAPMIVGVLWNGRDKPPTGSGPLVGPDGKVNQRIITSRSGHTVILDDTAGQEKIVIRDKTGKNSITIDSVVNSMTIQTQGDLVLDVGGKFTVNSKLDMALETQTGYSVKAQTNLQMQAQTGANVKSGQSELDLGPAGSAVKGMKVDIQSNSVASLKGTAVVEIQGALVKIN